MDNERVGAVPRYAVTVRHRNTQEDKYEFESPEKLSQFLEQVPYMESGSGILRVYIDEVKRVMEITPEFAKTIRGWP